MLVILSNKYNTLYSKYYKKKINIQNFVLFALCFTNYAAKHCTKFSLS